MNKNSLLNIAVFLCKFAKLLVSLIFLGITILFLHFQIDRSAYKAWNIQNPNNSLELKFLRADTLTNVSDGAKLYPVGDLSTVSLYFIYLKFGGIIILIFLSIHQFQKVMQSVKNLQTFQDLNVRSFRKIGLYCILIFCLNTFSYWDSGTYITQSVSINTTPLLIALFAFIFAFIFAEIFKEGNLLMEENKLTV